MDENIEQLKRIEELLNKAQKVYSKASEKEPRPTTLKQQNDVKQVINEQKTQISKVPTSIPTSTSSTKSISRLPLSKTTNKKPVFMSAPFKTDQNVNMFKNTKPKMATISAKANSLPIKVTKSSGDENAMLINKSSSKSSLPSIEQLEEKINLKVAISSSSTSKPQEDEENKRQIRFILKKDGKELRLPPNTENLVVKNFRLKQNLLKISRSQAKSAQSRDNFREKIEKMRFKQSSPAFLHFLINKLSLIYEALSSFIRLTSTEYGLLNVNTETKDELNKLRLIKLCKLAEKIQSIEVKLGTQVDAVWLQVKTHYTLSNKTINIFDSKAFKSNKPMKIEAEDGDKISKFMPISYKSENELKKFFELKLTLIELEFKRLFIKFLDDFYLNNHFNTNNSSLDESFIEKFNLLFGLITDKRSIIVKQ